MSQRKPKTVDDIILKKCEVCHVNDIPPYNRNGEPITRQSKYDEKKTCGPECFRISKQTALTVSLRAKAPLPEPTAVDLFLKRALHG